MHLTFFCSLPAFDAGFQTRLGHASDDDYAAGFRGHRCCCNPEVRINSDQAALTYFGLAADEIQTDQFKRLPNRYAFIREPHARMASAFRQYFRGHNLAHGFARWVIDICSILDLDDELLMPQVDFLEGVDQKSSVGTSTSWRASSAPFPLGWLIARSIQSRTSGRKKREVFSVRLEQRPTTVYA